MKFKHSSEILQEQTYGLTAEPLTFDSMLNVVTGWRMIDMLTDPQRELSPGFSIQSNQRGQGGEDPSKVLHHIFGNWKFENTTAISVKQHSILHNRIRLSIKEVLKNNSVIKTAYTKYRAAYSGKFSYDAAGKQLEAYEDFLRVVSATILNTDFKEQVKQIYYDTFTTESQAG